MYVIQKRYQDATGYWDDIMHAEGVFETAKECKEHCLKLAEEVLKNWHALGGYDSHLRGEPHGWSVRCKRSLMRFRVIEVRYGVSGDREKALYNDRGEALARAQALANGYLSELEEKFEEMHPNGTFLGHCQMTSNGFSVVTTRPVKEFTVEIIFKRDWG